MFNGCSLGDTKYFERVIIQRRSIDRDGKISLQNTECFYIMLVTKKKFTVHLFV